MENRDQFVDFDKFCNKCEYFKKEQYEEPCNECLENPINTYSNKPVNFKQKEVNKKIIKKKNNKN